MLLPFWNGTRRISQPVLNRILIGCKAAGIEATLDTLLGVRQPLPQAVLPEKAVGPSITMCDHHDLLEALETRVDRLGQLYDALTFAERLQVVEQQLNILLAQS